MIVLTLQLSESKHKQLAKSKGMSINRLLDEATTLMLAKFDLETQFRLRAKRGTGKAARGLELLEKAIRSS